MGLPRTGSNVGGREGSTVSPRTRSTSAPPLTKSAEGTCTRSSFRAISTVEPRLRSAGRWLSRSSICLLGGSVVRSNRRSLCGRVTCLRTTPRLTAALLLVVFASAAEGGPRTQCRRACGSAVRSCMTASGQGLRACKEQVLRRCAREGLPACSSSPLPPGASRCSESGAPACAGSCPLAEFSCVPNPRGGCNCEAPACDRARSSSCNGVCRHAGRVCVARGGRCKCV